MPHLDYEAWRFWLGILQFVGTVFIGVYVWWTNREKVTSKRFKALEEDVKERVTRTAMETLEKERKGRCDQHRERTSINEKTLERIASEIKHLPSQGDIGKVHSRMDAVSKEMDQAVGELKATTRQLDLVLEQLLRRNN